MNPLSILEFDFSDSLKINLLVVTTFSQAFGVVLCLFLSYQQNQKQQNNKPKTWKKKKWVLENGLRMGQGCVVLREMKPSAILIARDRRNLIVCGMMEKEWRREEKVCFLLFSFFFFLFSFFFFFSFFLFISHSN